MVGVALTFYIIMLPVHGIANFGTMEAGWAGVFILLGMPATIAVSTAFSFHFILFIFFMVLGIPGIIRINT